MRVAFYAPLKPPDHRVPSGDREMGRLLWRALVAAGHRPCLASRLRSWDGAGDRGRQRRIRALGARVAAGLHDRLAALGPEQRPDCWFTYHLYHKAPDWVGPPVSRALGIPYVVAEASNSPRRARGPWSEGYRAAARAIADAAVVVNLNPVDREGVAGLVREPGRVHTLAPFIDASRFAGGPPRDRLRAAYARDLGIDPGVPWLCAVAMMRSGDKLSSWFRLADALARLRGQRWALVAAGDGAERAAVEAALRTAAPGRVAFTGEIGPEAVARLLGACDLFVWPAVNEAWGMALIEAAAAGLPVVAGRAGGVGAVVADGETGLLAPPGDTDAFADAVTGLLEDPGRAAAMGARARRRVVERHDLAAAARGLDAALAAALAAAGAGA